MCETRPKGYDEAMADSSQAKVIPIHGSPSADDAGSRTTGGPGSTGGADQASLGDGLLEAAGALAQGLAARTLGDDWRTKVAGGLEFARRRLTGEYEVDDLGFDPDLTENVLLAILRPL